MTENWNYEVAYNYGQFDEDTIVRGNMNLQRFGLAMDAATNTTGQIVCRSQIDPAAAFRRSERRRIQLSVDTLAADVAACAPLNPFGQGNISQAARDFVLQDTTSVGQIKQQVIQRNDYG